MPNFTLVDTLGTLKACVALAPLMVAPGYVIGWTLNLFEFRQRRLILRFIIALPLSTAICPMLSYLLARFVPAGLQVFYISALVACLLPLYEVRSVPMRSISRPAWVATSLAVLWTIVAIASVVDLQFVDRLYPPVTAFDDSTRVAIVAAIARHVPPSNPFFVHPSVPLRYHYLWLLLCSLPLKIIHLQPRHIAYAGIVWCGLSLMCVIALGLKFWLHITNNLARQALLGVALLSVTGLDILPNLYVGFGFHFWLSDTEWWNESQITSWAGSLLWVPHNVAALIACFLAFLLLRHETAGEPRRFAIPVIAAGLAFAGAAGMSVYVTFTFVVAVGLWLLALAARKQWREAGMFLGAGAVAFCWGLSFLLGLRSPAAGSASSGPIAGGAFAELGLRSFVFGIQLARRAGISLDSPFSVTFANAVFLPINYALELGFFLAVGIVRLRQVLRRQVGMSTNEQAAWTLVATSFLVGTFFRSTTTGTNDLGWRCFLPAQFILLLWGATMVHAWWFRPAAEPPQLRPRARAGLASLLILGTIGTAYQVFMIRLFPVLYDRSVIAAGQTWLESDRQFGARTYAVRSVYESLDAQLPRSAVFQNNPATQDPVPHTLYSGHDSVAGAADCFVQFGGDPNSCQERVYRLKALFDGGGDPASVCRDYGIDVLVALDTDGAWQDSSSWVWRTSPLVSNSYVRAFLCRKSGSS